MMGLNPSPEGVVLKRKALRNSQKKHGSVGINSNILKKENT